MKKRRKTFSQKRTTLPTLLLSALALVLVLTMIFAVGFQMYLKHSIDSQGKEQIADSLHEINRTINHYAEDYADLEQNDRFMLIHQMLGHYTESFTFMLPNKVSDEEAAQLTEDYTLVGIDSRSSLNCDSYAVLMDQDGNTVASSSLFLEARIIFSDDNPNDAYYYPNTNYICDPETLNIPEVNQFFDLYLEHARQREDKVHDVQARITSVYVNRENHTFIPHKGTLEDYSYPRAKLNTNGVYDSMELTEYPIEINVALPGYELVELHEQAEKVYSEVSSDGSAVIYDESKQPAEQAYPWTYNTLLWFYGESNEIRDKFQNMRVFSYSSYPQNTYKQLGTGMGVFDDSRQILIEGQPYWLNLRLIIDYKDSRVVRYFWSKVLLCAVLLSLLALVWCLWKNMRNKARYAMEDYQRALTDSLAHDIKTPLMAISGYAENIRDGNLSEEKQKNYVSGILKNIASTDTMISRTLYLNHIDNGMPAKIETVRLAALTGTLIDKYDLMLREKHIQAKITGSAELQTDPAAMETILENLISNAVKYTPEGGNIQIGINKKSLTITNTVAQKIDFKKLKEPFVRGDTARSNASGNGLGLAIVDRAADVNGFKFNLSCTDTEFMAELKF